MMDGFRALNLMEEEIQSLPYLGLLHPKRLDILKKGNRFYLLGQHKQAIYCYTLYLNILCKYKKVNKNDLHPGLFSQPDEKLELIVICSLYWKISLIYDQLGSLQEKLEDSLNQFKIFSVGFPYYRANLEILRKYIKTKRIINKDIFKRIHHQMNLYSNHCYISTHCFGHNHPVTMELRKLKASLLPCGAGRFIISQYYRYSPKLVLIFKINPLIGFLLTKILIKPLIRLIAFTYKNRYIIR